MLDSRGIFREACMDCGEEECAEFQKVETTPFCGYCGCAATKHKKRKIAEGYATNASPSKNDAMSSVVSVEKISECLIAEMTENVASVAPLIPIETVASKKLESLIPDLPIFSKSIEEALKGNFEKSKLWDNFIMQTSAHYINCPYMSTSTAYGIVGKRMFEKYPSIKADGNKPWSKFAKALSSKMRKDRWAKRVLDNLQNKSFTNLQSMDIKERDPSRNFTVGKQTTSILLRTQTVLPTKSPSEIIEMQQKLADEWKKPKPEKTMLKHYLRETFSDRTVLLKDDSSFEKILAFYPCFSSADYFIVEFGIMVGQNVMKNLSSKLKEFFAKVQDKLDISNKYDDPLLAAWLTFEKKVSITQTKELRYVPIIEITEKFDEYLERIENVPATQSPCAIVLIKEMEITDAAILYSGHFISGTSKGVMGILTALLGVYYTLELNYPAQYVQAMGALGVFVLEHEYYKLCKNAKNVLALLK